MLRLTVAKSVEREGKDGRLSGKTSLRYGRFRALRRGTLLVAVGGLGLALDTKCLLLQRLNLRVTRAEPVSKATRGEAVP